MTFRQDTRGASIALNHALSIGITTLLIAGLMLGAGQQLETRRERVAEQGLTDIGESMTNELSRVDRLAQDRGVLRSDVTSRVTYPHYVSGSSYDVSLQERPGGTAVLYLNTSTPTVRVPFEVAVDSDVCERGVNGGPVEIAYDEREDCLTIRPTGR